MLKIGDTEIKAIKIGNQDVKKVMLGTTQVWPVEVSFWEVTDTLSDMSFINSSSTSNNDRVYIEYEVPFDMSPDSVITFTWNAPKFNAGIYGDVPIWLVNGKNMELVDITASTKSGTLKKKISELKYYADSWFASRKFKFLICTYKTTTAARSAYLGDNFTYTLRIDK